MQNNECASTSGHGFKNSGASPQKIAELKFKFLNEKWICLYILHPTTSFFYSNDPSVACFTTAFFFGAAFFFAGRVLVTAPIESRA